jgi:hypothetical protein
MSHFPHSVILHIGKGKTGSSSIQQFLQTNRDILESCGILLVLPEIPAAGYQLSDFSHPEKYHQALQYLKEFSQERHFSTILWTNETFEHLTVDFIYRFREMFPASSFRIIVFLRRQDQWIQSAYCQWGVKHKIYPGPVKSFDAFLNERLKFSPSFSIRFKDSLNYLALVDRWASVFGRENIRVQPYECGQFPEGLENRFMKLAGFPKDMTCRVPQNPTNPSFASEIYELIRVYNSRFAAPHYPSALVSFFETILDETWLKPPHADFSLISPSRCIEILKECDPFNRKIAVRYLNREDGRLFYDPWPNPDAPFEESKSMTMDALIPVLLDILVNLLQMIRKKD